MDVTTYGTKYPFKIYYDEKMLTAEELVKEDNAYMDMYFKKRGLSDKPLEEKINKIKETQRLDYIYYGVEDSYLSLPFYSYKNNKVTYLPRNIYRLSYGSNGMSAGNTYDEAIVQGLSEIIERFVQRKIISEKITLPDIPDSYIRKFPYIYYMLDKLRSNKKFTCFLKDCSLGGHYPVSALVILEKDTGKYGIKLGCHPDYGMAMERTFTEAAQGQDIFQYSDRSSVDFNNKDVTNEMNIYNTFKIGKGQYPYQFFGNIPTYEFVLKCIIDVLEHRGENIDHTDLCFCRAVYYYLNGIKVLDNRDDVIGYMNKLFNEDICFKVITLLKDPHKVITLQYPSITDEKNKLNQDNQILQLIREKFKEEQLNNKLNQKDLIIL